MCVFQYNLSSLLDYQYTDTDLADQVKFSTGEFIRATREGKYFVYEEGFWEGEENKALLYKTVEHCVIKRFELAEKVYKWGSAELKNDWKFYTTCRGASKIDAGIRLLGRKILCKMDAFDNSPDLLGVQNGIINLTTGEFREVQAEDMITRRMNIEYDTEAKAPRFIQFFEEVLPDAEVREYFLTYLGYCLTGGTELQDFVVLKGAGDSGKSLIIRILNEVFGDYGDIVGIDTFSAKNRETIRTDLMALQGRRLIFAEEPDKNFEFDLKILKPMTGEGVLAARYMKQNQVRWKATNKLILTFLTSIVQLKYI